MAYFKDVIKLVSVEIAKDELRQEIQSKTEREVFANKRSVSQSEFFNAGLGGMKAQYAFDIRLVDYEGENSLIFNEREYSIYRTFEKGENIELYCEVRAAGN